MKTLALTALATLWLATAAYAQLNPMTEVAVYTGEAYYDNFGGGLTCGDFNHDGYEDILIGAWGWNNGTGKNYFYYGGPTWPTEPGLTIQGENDSAWYDITDLNMGDINADGTDDFCLRRIIYLDNINRLDLFWGGQELDTIPDWKYTYSAPEQMMAFPAAIDSCEDLNGDGEIDFGLSIQHALPVNKWYIWLFWGGAQLDTVPDWQCTVWGYHFAGLGDINDDGFADILNMGLNSPGQQPRIFFGGNPMDTIPDLTFSLLSPTATGGGIGDVNADGYNDFCLSLQRADNRSWFDEVYFGGTHVDTIPDIYLLNRFGQRCFSQQYITHGDFNSDGISDIACDAGDLYMGEVVYVYLGSPEFNAVPDAMTSLGSVWDEYGYRIASGDLNSDGHDELLVTSLNYPYPAVGRVYVYTGPETWIDYGAQAVPWEELQHNPGWFKLEQNYPNPFNSTTSLHFSLGKPSTVTIQIYDAKGERIKQLLDHQKMTPGGYNVSWTGKNEAGQPCASGIYLLELQVDQYREMKKMVLVR